MKMRSNGPPLIPPLPLHLATLEMVIVGKNQDVASPLFTGDDVRQILCHHYGTFVLRIEDLDRPRVVSGASEQMLADLRWLGLDWDEGPDVGGAYAPYIQSERLAIYSEYLRRLDEAGLIYPCYCSRAEIARAASAPHGEEGPRYPGTCRYLSAAQRRQFEAEGRRPSLRLRVPAERVIAFSDLLTGPLSQPVQQAVGDFILRRS